MQFNADQRGQSDLSYLLDYLTQHTRRGAGYELAQEQQDQHYHSIQVGHRSSS
jgi:hypothetical protein